MLPLRMLVTVVAMLCVAFQAAAQPFQPGTGFVPAGNLRTTDRDGPYNLTLLSQQANEVKAGIAARGNFTDLDIVHFLTNVECLEGLFDTWGTFGRGFLGDLEKGGPTPIGAQKANIQNSRTRGFLEEVALNEQGHALFTRHAGSSIPCPAIDFLEGFNGFMAFAYGIPVPSGSNARAAVKGKYGVEFDPFQDDATYTLCVLSLEELGATGNKGLAGITSNPVIANGIAGLATSANSQATVERTLLYDMRNSIIAPFNETAQQVFARISALRDYFDGPQIDDQGLLNYDPRFIAVPTGFVNNVPTDIRGLTFNRSPQQIINILTLGSPDGVGNFFPNGLNGNIKSPAGFNLTAVGLDDFPFTADTSFLDFQESAEQVGSITPPITGAHPTTVPGQSILTQAQDGPLEDETYLTRAYENFTAPISTYGNDPAPTAGVPVSFGTLAVPPSKCPAPAAPHAPKLAKPLLATFPAGANAFHPFNRGVVVESQGSASAAGAPGASVAYAPTAATSSGIINA